MNKPSIQTIVSAVLACAVIGVSAYAYQLYGNNVALNEQIAENTAKVSAAKTQIANIDNLNAQIADLQSQLDSKTTAYNELAGELDGAKTSNLETQEIYDQGWLDACDNYGIDVGTEDVPDYGYYGQMTEPESPTAYITPTGNRYHLSQSCAGENAIQTTIAGASEKGYTPCANCVQ